MAVTHHIGDEFLMAYAAGVLSEAFGVVVAAHVSLSDDSRARLGAYDSVGGAVLDAVDPADMDGGALAATLARIKGHAPTPRPAPVRRDQKILPEAVQRYVGGDINAVAWRTIGRGVKQAILPTRDEARVRLLYIPSGMAMPDHGHGGTEMTLVLQGAYRDADGIYKRGDIEVADEAVQHTPVAFGPDDCICLTATDARLRFTSVLPRLAQPFLRI